MGVKLWIKLSSKIFTRFFVIPIRIRKLTSQFCICSGSSGCSLLCKQTFSHWTFTEVSRSPISLCESRISEKWVVAIMQFCYVLCQIHYLQQKFYKEINFLLLSDVCCKTLFLFGRILPFPGRKIRTTVERGNYMVLFQEEETECRNIHQEDFLAPSVPLVYFWGQCFEHVYHKKSIDSTMAAKST